MIELHRHLEGSIRPNTIFELRERSPLLANRSFEQIQDMMQITGRVDSLASFIMRLGTKMMREVIKTDDDVYRFVLEAIEDGAAEGLEMLELRFCPGVFSPTEREVIFKAMNEASRNFDIKVGLIYCLRRDDKRDVNFQYIAEGIRLFEAEKVIGFDLAGNEKVRPNEEFADLLVPVDDIGIPLTVHAGEADGPHSVISAIKLLKADRIGHGTSSALSADAMKFLREENVLVECCLTSNYQTRAIAEMDQHPIKKFLENGVPVAICTDDPITCSTTVKSEIEKFEGFYGLNKSELEQISAYAREFTFIQ